MDVVYYQLPEAPPGDFSGGALLDCFSIADGGNGVCHCFHVEAFMEYVEDQKKNRGKGSDPWRPGCDGGAGVSGGLAPPTDEAKRAGAP